MSKAYKCDRCGAFYEPSGKGSMLFEYYENALTKTKRHGDICPSCAEKFAKWWNKPKGGAEDGNKRNS